MLGDCRCAVGGSAIARGDGNGGGGGGDGGSDGAGPCRVTKGPTSRLELQHFPSYLVYQYAAFLRKWRKFSMAKAFVSRTFEVLDTRRLMLALRSASNNVTR
ncbi:hypothetical protein M0804_007080 [Polistes exclamans]|nr:hypothetical protein M0804_007080 [Polistes exclamans]